MDEGYQSALLCRDMFISCHHHQYTDALCLLHLHLPLQQLSGAAARQPKQEQHQQQRRPHEQQAGPTSSSAAADKLDKADKAAAGSKAAGHADKKPAAGVASAAQHPSGSGNHSPTSHDQPLLQQQSSTKEEAVSRPHVKVSGQHTAVGEGCMWPSCMQLVLQALHCYCSCAVAGRPCDKFIWMPGLSPSYWSL